MTLKGLKIKKINKKFSPLVFGTLLIDYLLSWKRIHQKLQKEIAFKEKIEMALKGLQIKKN